MQRNVGVVNPSVLHEASVRAGRPSERSLRALAGGVVTVTPCVAPQRRLRGAIIPTLRQQVDGVVAQKVLSIPSPLTRVPARHIPGDLVTDAEYPQDDQ